MKKKMMWRGIVRGIIPFVFATVLISSFFQSCQKEIVEPEGQDELVLKSATIQSVVYPEIFVGPETFSPIKGKMVMQSVTLENSSYEDYGTLFALIVKNGDDNGLNMVQGADIYVNGTLLVTLADFRKAPAVITREINNLGASTTIDVEVKGKTTGILTVWIEGILKQGPLATFTDTRDGHQYKMVIIGNQIWMAENLAYLPFVNGWYDVSKTDPKYYVYPYDGTDLTVAKASENYAKYGALYNWTAAQSACPTGWHLPSAAEWAELEDYLIANGYNYDGSTEGNKLAKSLAAQTDWNQCSEQGTPGFEPELNNSSRFGALPAGRRSDDWGSWPTLGNTTNWWTSTYSEEVDYLGNVCVFTEQMNYNFYNTGRRNNGSVYNDGFSIRCIKD